MPQASLLHEMWEDLRFAVDWRFSEIFCSSNCSSQPSMVHWLSSSIFPCLVVRSVGCPAMVTPVQISLLVAPPIHFLKAYDNSLQK